MKPSIIFSSAVLAAVATSLAFFARAQPPQPVSQPRNIYLGFDRDIYPGDVAFATLRKNFTFTGYWLGPPPAGKNTTWLNKRDFLRRSGFGFLVLFSGRDGNELKNEHDAAAKGANDGRSAAAAAKREGFPAATIIFLDIEEGGRLSAAYHAYLRVWFDDLARRGYRAGVYCSGMPAKETGGITILTADNIRANAGNRDFAFFVYNDACPPSPGCTFSAEAPAPSASGVSFAQAWQFAQSPRRKPGNTHNLHDANSSPRIARPAITRTAIATAPPTLPFPGNSMWTPPRPPILQTARAPEVAIDRDARRGVSVTG